MCIIFNIYMYNIYIIIYIYIYIYILKVLKARHLFLNDLLIIYISYEK